MSFHPCIVIPTYNNGDTIGEVIESIRRYALPTFIIDDGSNVQSREVIQAIAAQYSWVRVLYIPINSGKGSALVLGFTNAFESGFSHAVQIDADSQHNADDIPLFLEAARTNPSALILGDPIFDNSAPKSRLYGRRFNHPWVWLETGSFAIHDALCGFRVYPLSSTVALLRTSTLGSRMEFDPEIAVRLAWMDVPMVNVPTKVRYFPGGVSHFRTVRDNFRITWLHTRFVIIACFRALLRLCTKGTSYTWTTMPERGSIIGLRIMLRILESIGPKACKLFVYPISLYFFLTGHASRRASYDYLQRVALCTGKRRLSSVQHFAQFGYSIVDKVAAWRGDFRDFELEWEGIEIFHNLLATRQGAVLLSAHLGNLEVLRAASEAREGVTVNAIMFTRNAKKFNELLAVAGKGKHSMRVIGTESITPALVIDLRERIQQGEFVAMFADRVLQGSPHKVSLVPFLRGNAPFPHGPFVLASLLECPVFTLFATRLEGKRYKITIEPFADKLACNRKERAVYIERIIQLFAERLEKACLRSPLQWFNFYNFWPSDSPQEQREESIVREKRVSNKDVV